MRHRTDLCKHLLPRYTDIIQIGSETWSAFVKPRLGSSKSGRNVFNSVARRVYQYPHTRHIAERRGIELCDEGASALETRMDLLEENLDSILETGCSR